MNPKNRCCALSFRRLPRELTRGLLAAVTGATSAPIVAATVRSDDQHDDKEDNDTEGAELARSFVLTVGGVSQIEDEYEDY